MKGLIFTFALTYGGALMSLFRPFHGFLIYVAFANLKPESLWHWSVPAGNYSRTIAVALLIGWVIHGTGNWSVGRGTATVRCLLFFWGWLLLCAIISPVQERAWSNFWSLSKIYLPFVVGVTLLDSTEKLKQLAWVIVLSQGYLALEFNLFYYSGGLNPQDWMFATMDNNTIAITTVSSVGVAFFLGMHAEKVTQKLIAFGCMALMAHVVLFSMSRGAMLAMCVTGVVSFLLIPKRPVHLLVFAIAMALVFRLAGADVTEEFNSSFADQEHRDASAQSRFDLTRDALHCMFTNPIFGCGMENWGNQAPVYGWPRGKEVHNTWAQLGAELGLPGLISIILYYAIAYVRLVPLAFEKSDVSDDWLRAFSRMVLASIAGFVVSAAAVTVEGIELPYYVMTLAVGVLRIHAREMTDRSDALESVPATAPIFPTTAGAFH